MQAELERVGETGVVEMDGPWIKRIVEKPLPGQAPSGISSLPLYCFSPRILDYVPDVRLSTRGEYELQDAIQMLIDRAGRVGGGCRRRIDQRHRFARAQPLPNAGSIVRSSPQTIVRTHS
jgi:dTDP-glucose pyrophosphorylase